MNDGHARHVNLCPRSLTTGRDLLTGMSHELIRVIPQSEERFRCGV